MVIQNTNEFEFTSEPVEATTQMETDRLPKLAKFTQGLA